jgi:MoxR-like ATPase
MNLKTFIDRFEAITDNVNSVFYGKDDVVRLALVAILAGGHVLFEDVPGVGKSVLARSLGQSMEADMNRVQCTPDMLPGDITGSTVIDTATMKLSFRPGPIFTNVLLVDEINRATPKTQSALLEAMAERNVSIDGTTHRLPTPFLVLATQNPVELAGTFPLPEAQLDRFLFKLSIGYPDLGAEKAVARGNRSGLEVEGLGAVLSREQVVEMSDFTATIEVSDAVETYVVELVQATRVDPACAMGAGPRASIALLRAASVLAAADGRDHVYPEDVKALLRPTLNHRMMLSPDAVLRGESVDDVLDRVTNRVKAPMSIGRAAPAAAPTSPAGQAPKPRRRATAAKAG